MDTNLATVLSLSKGQDEKFQVLKKAYMECMRAGIKFINVYGSLYAVPKKNVEDYGDSSFPPEGELLIELHGSFPADYLKIPTEWSDDSHIVGLTEAGAKIYNDND